MRVEMDDLVEQGGRMGDGDEEMGELEDSERIFEERKRLMPY